MKLIDLFAEMDKKHLKIKDQLRNEFVRVKELIGKVPLRVELFTYMDDAYQMAIKYPKDNSFKRYMEFLKELNELSVEEEIVFQGIGREFINHIENTNMSKVYKMSVLMAFYNDGDVRMSVSEEQLLTSWKDLETSIKYERYQAISDKDHLKKIIQMLGHFLQESGKGFFVKEDGAVLVLRVDLCEVIHNEAFVKRMGDVIAYRTMDYYRRRYREKAGE